MYVFGVLFVLSSIEKGRIHNFMFFAVSQTHYAQLYANEGIIIETHPKNNLLLVKTLTLYHLNMYFY